MQISIKLFLLFALVCLTTSLPTDLRADESARIVNGVEVDITQIPYHAGLRRKVAAGWAYTCGAAVISFRAVLTAAHCVIGYETSPSYLRVAVGTSFRLSGGKTYDLSRVNMHEAYDTATLVNDIAMLVTNVEITFGPSVIPIPFATSNFVLPAGEEAVVSGYGQTAYEGAASSVLRAAQVKIVQQNVCERAYLRIATIYSGMLCANATNPPRDACQGDSGGPLVARNHLIGIVSWGEGCADKLYPGVYTRVSKYELWIREKLGQIF